MATEKLIITKDDLSEWVEVGANIAQTRLDRAIQNAQIMDLRAFMGDTFYRDFINKVFVSTDPDFTKYQNLLNGVDYTFQENTIHFYGLIPLLSFWSWARYTKTGNVQSSRAGLVFKKTEQSEHATEREISRMVIDSNDKAGAFLNDARQFLDEEDATYPLWNESPTRRVQTKQGMSITRVQPSTKDGRLTEPRFDKLADEEFPR